MTDIKKFHEFIDDVRILCTNYNISYELLETTAKLLDDFGWENDPAMILSAMIHEPHSSKPTRNR